MFPLPGYTRKCVRLVCFVIMCVCVCEYMRVHVYMCVEASGI